jgi:hypothetical protein
MTRYKEAQGVTVTFFADKFLPPKTMTITAD